jgi:hypothetical protein
LALLVDEEELEHSAGATLAPLVSGVEMAGSDVFSTAAIAGLVVTVVDLFVL